MVKDIAANRNQGFPIVPLADRVFHLAQTIDERLPIRILLHLQKIP